MKSSLSILSLLVSTSWGFSPIIFTTQSTKTRLASMNLSTTTESTPDNEESSSSTRRSFFGKLASSSAALVVSSGAAMSSFSSPANAIGGGLKKVNAKLQSYGLPQIQSIPDNFSPLVEIWGKGSNRDPLLVQFSHPIDWVVTLPSQDVNGEDGTIQAGEYAKGDTATFYVLENSGKVENINEQPKEFFKNAVIKAISQKGDSIYQDFKVTKLVPKTVNGQEYMMVDFKYTLLTGAGFEVDRVGVSSVTSTGKNVELLWTASTRQRYKKTEEQLRNIADSFRCYADGLDLAKLEYQLDKY